MRSDSIQAIQDTAKMLGHAAEKMPHGNLHHQPSIWMNPMTIGIILFILTTIGLTFWAKKMPKYAKMLKRIRLLFQLTSGIVIVTGISIRFLRREYVRFFIEQSNQLVLVGLIFLATIIIDALR